MRTEVININSNGDGFDEALEAAHKAAEYAAPDKKTKIQIRLLAEETIGMVAAITKDYNALFWAESAKKKGCRIHLKAYTDMTWHKKNELLSASKSGKNEAAKGIMGKLRDLFENGMYSLDQAGSEANEQGNPSLMYGTTGFDDKESSSVISWSMKSYKEESAADGTLSPRDKQVWDELEKSIVANVADDVKVLVTGDSVELMIEKNFS